MKQRIAQVWALFLLLSSSPLFSQTYDMSYRSKIVIETDAGYIYDNGGETGNYSPNSSDTLVIKPATEGASVIIDFSSFLISTPQTDYLEVYAGEGTDKLICSSSMYYPTSVYSPDQTGILTLVFYSDESSEAAGFEISIAVLPTIPVTDLSYQDSYMYQDSVVAGTSAYLRTGITNYGPDAVRYAHSEIYLSSDTILDEEDSLLANQYIHLSADASVSYGYNLDIPANTPAGNYYVICRLTDGAGNLDSNPDDNTIHFPLKVIEQYCNLRITVQEYLPDIDILNSNMTNTMSCHLNYETNYRVQNVNIGAYLSEDREFDEGDINLSMSSISYVINTGIKLVSVSIEPFDAEGIEEGIYYLLVVADSDSAIVENDESDNVLVTQVILDTSPGSLQNLWISDISPLSDSIEDGSYLYTGIVLNSSERLNQYPYLSWYLSADSILNTEEDVYLSRYNIYNRFEGEYLTYSGPKISLNNDKGINPGKNYIIAYIDEPDYIREANERDNILSCPVYIETTSRCDLKFASSSLKQDTVLSTNDIAVDFDVLNDANHHIESITMNFYLSDDEVYDENDIRCGSKNYSLLFPGNVSSYTYYSTNFLLPAGDYFLVGLIDQDNYIAETDESNNSFYLPVTIIDTALYDSVDMELLDVQFPDTIVSLVQNPVSFEYFLHAKQSEYLNFAVYFSYDSVLNLRDMETQLFERNCYAPFYESATFSTEVNILEDLDPGKYYIIVKADSYNVFNEDSETNNVIIKPFVVDKPEYIKLAFTALEARSTLLYRDAIYTGSFSYNNTGTVISDTVVIEALIASKDDPDHFSSVYIDTAYNVNNTEREGNFSFLVPDTLNNGLYTLQLSIKDISRGEDDLSDNTISTLFGVQDPGADYVVENLLTGDDKISYQENLAFSYDCSNIGITESGTIEIGYYLSEDDVFSAEDSLLDIDLVTTNGLEMISNKSASVLIPELQEPGYYHILVVADPENKVPELNENNNSIAGLIEVLLPGVNLTVNDLQLTQDTIPTGQSLSCYYHLENIGNQSSPTFYTAIYLSKDSIPGPDATYLTRRSMSIPAGSGYTGVSSIQISSTIDTGDYYLICMTDYLETVSEISEEDNWFSAPLKVIAPRIDYEIIETELPDTLRIVANQVNSMEISVINNGIHSASSSITLYMYLSEDDEFDPFVDMYISAFSNFSGPVSGYTAEVSSNLTISDDIGNGNYWLFLFLDPVNAVKETDELNNVTALPLRLMDQDVDLCLTNFQETNDTVSLNSTLRVEYTIQNAGLTTSYKSIYTRITLSKDTLFDPTDDVLYNIAASPVMGGEWILYSRSLSIPSSAEEGWYYILIELDESNRIDETDETNNTAFDSVYLKTPDIDFQFDSYSISDVYLTSYVYATMSCSITNTGTESVNSSFYVEYYLSEDTIFDDTDVFVDRDYVSGLNASSTKSVSEYGRIPYVEEGEYYMLYVLDSRDVIPEKDESNNIAYLPVGVNISEPNTDYFIEGFAYSVPDEIDSITFNLTVINSGTTDGEGTTSCAFYMSNVPYVDDNCQFIGEYQVEELAAGTSQEINCSYKLPALRYLYVITVVDPLNLIMDSNTDNNTVVYNMVYPEIPFDLNVICQLEPEAVNPGDTLNVSTLITCTGDFYLEYSQLSYRLSSDLSSDPDDLILFDHKLRLDIDKETYHSLKVIVPPDIDSGRYFILIEANIDSLWIEKDPTNNYCISEFRVLGNPVEPEVMDIAIHSPFSIEDVMAGDTVEVHYTLENTGEAKVFDIDLEYFISTDEELDASDTQLYSEKKSALEPGSEYNGSCELIIPENTLPGNYSVMILANADSLVFETDTTDNIAYLYYQIHERTGVENNLTSSGILLYPNPVSDHLHLKSVNRMEAFEIVSLDGRVLHNGLIRNMEAEIEVTDLTPGFYLLVVRADLGRTVLKFEVAR